LERDRSDKRFGSILIVGLGLIGGSFAAALKRTGTGGGAPFVYGYDSREEAVSAAVGLGYVDAAVPYGELRGLLAGGAAASDGIVDGAARAGHVSSAVGTGEAGEGGAVRAGEAGEDSSARTGEAAAVGLIVLAVPAGVLGEWFGLIADSGYEGVVTDVCSTKAGAVKLARSSLRYPELFVPGHPMAGSEQSGIAAADAGLFSGAYWILTPGEDTDAEAYGDVHALLAAVGARVLSVSPDEHDRVVAIVSHVPHVAAAALVALAGKHAGKDGDMLRLAAGGFKDTTRVASGSADLWTGILTDNAAVVAEELSEYGQVINEFERLVRAGDADALRALLSDAAEVRNSLPSKWVAQPEALTIVRVPMDDRKGIIAEITTAADRAGCNIEAIDIDHITEDRAELELALTGEGDADGFMQALEDAGFRPRFLGL
jgi:prephenate dehydrogenase